MKFRILFSWLLIIVSGLIFAGDEAGDQSSVGQTSGDQTTGDEAGAQTNADKTGNPKTLRIVFAGDIMGHDSQIAAAHVDSTDTYNYMECFQHIAPYLREADIAVGNLEVTLAGAPYKGYPRFSSPDELTDALAGSGINVLVNANNHALDRGEAGFERTHIVLAEKGIILTGSFLSSSQKDLSYPLIIEKNGILLAMLNYTYGTNGLVVDTPYIVNYLDTLQIRQDIMKAKLVEPDFIIACIHWGTEYQREENTVQRSIAALLFEQGVDAVIGSHPHVVQPVRFEKDGSYYKKPVVYSLGNFVSNQRDRYRNGGIIVGLDLEKTDSTRISGLDYLPFYVHKPKREEKITFELIPSGIPENRMREIGFSEDERDSYLEFCNDTKQHLSNIPQKPFLSNEKNNCP